MDIQIESKPSYSMAVVTLDEGESFIAESGSMVAMSNSFDVDTTFNGRGTGFFDFLQALFVGLLRKFLAGETLFVNTYRSKKKGSELMVAPAMVGDIVNVAVSEDKPFTVQATSFLASTTGVASDLIWGGFSMLFAKEGAFFLRCRGSGDLLINSYGAIEKVEVDGSYIVDSGHVVGFQGNLKYSIQRVGGWKATLLSGEGLVLSFSGQGTVWLQTRNMGSLVGWLTPMLPK
ncbi:MAG: TIGR00266 family protein [Myxococcota bacterium]|nr:TIGR00266 family protein [Myxococcota bacterium]